MILDWRWRWRARLRISAWWAVVVKLCKARNRLIMYWGHVKKTTSSKITMIDLTMEACTDEEIMRLRAKRAKLMDKLILSDIKLKELSHY